MKKRFFISLFGLLTAIVLACGLFACGGGGKPKTPQKLNAPVVTLTENVASWAADELADKFEISLDGTLSYVENSITSKTLTNGQSLKLRAVGDGINYLTSGWSNVVTYTASGENPPDNPPPDNPQPTQLSTPVVTVAEGGMASWFAVANARGYAYKINGGTETATAVTSVQLLDGQSIVVKAVGDGVNFLDSAYSAAQTYTATPSTPSNPTTPTQAPTYLGIKASLNVPSANDVPADFALFSTRISLDEALNAYLQDSENALGQTAPTDSGYETFSASGSTVYIQIWLNNPAQNTILSLKLNGVKYQSGGALQSFFVQDGATYLNCVYVAVAIPANSYREIAYEVTEIEYVEGANVNQDGKAVLIDENNDTVKIGLPFKETMPTVTLSGAAQTATTVSLTATVADADNYTALIGGWLRAVIYDNNNHILGQAKLTAGDNSVVFNGLSADTYYRVVAILYGDTRDGNGVCVHTIVGEWYQTEQVISCETQSEILLNAQTGKYYPQISVKASLNDSSFTFTKVEVCQDWNTVVYTGEFGGSIQIAENILNGKEYVVKVYYQNAKGVEQSYQDYVWVENLETPWVLEPSLLYGLVDDAILGFDFGENKCNMENLTIKILDEDSKQYIAEDALYLLENPNAIETLREQWQAMDRTHPDHFSTGKRIQELEAVQTKIERYYASVSKTEWQAEAAKGKYIYELVYGKDDGFFKGADNKYYVVLDGYQSKRVDDNSWRYFLTADFDKNNGEAVEVGKEIDDGWFNIKPALTENDYLFIASDDDYNEQFWVDENNVLYLEVMSRNNLGDESYRNLGYVNQIVIADGYEILYVLWEQDEPNHDIDEAAWLADIKQTLIAGGDIYSVFPLGELKPITFDLDEVENAPTNAGKFTIRYTYKMYGKTYTTEHPYDWDGAVIEHVIKGALPTAGIQFVGKGEDFGRWEIVYPDGLDGNGRWDYFTVEVQNENGQSVGTYTQNTYGEYERLPLNYSIRIRLDAYDGHEYYTDGAWSEWFTCTPITLSAPTNFRQEYGESGVFVAWNDVDGAEKYVYVLNGGEERETSSSDLSGLKGGDTLKVKAVPSANGNCLQSAYSEVYTVVDVRTPLAKPMVTFNADYKTLEWQAVENADYYTIYDAETGEIVHEWIGDAQCSAQVGRKYVVKAMSYNYETYCPSYSDEIETNVKLPTPTISVSDVGTVTFMVDGKIPGRLTYTYVVNGGQEKTTKNKSGEITLKKGDTIKVKISFGDYEDSDWSETVTFAG